MEEMYLREEGQGKGVRRLVILAAAILITGGALFMVFYRRAPKDDVPKDDITSQIENVVASGDNQALVQFSDELEPAADAVEVPAAPVKQSSFAKNREQTARLFNEAQELHKSNQLMDARAKYFEALNVCDDSVQQAEIEEALGRLHTEMVFTPNQMSEKVDYVIKSGDTLGRLASAHGTTVELIQKGNNIKGSLIRPGDFIRILDGTFAIEVDKSDNTLVVTLNDRFFKRYRVGTGKYGRTPVGDFKITDRQVKPTWWRPDGKRIPFGDKENLLGTHWLSLDVRGYGLHGTWEPDSIGSQSSAGCVRMLNENIEELYNLIPLGTKVTIKD
ncbi:MAG: L,D-transpeptidase [Spartobacteria bacterium]|nr:L,D-transpeptidase [Spartobacteria bacterium]